MRAITAEPVITRGSLLDALGEDYVRTARAKGLSERRVVYRHGLRSALIPVTTQLGVDLATDQNRIRIASSW